MEKFYVYLLCDPRRNFLPFYVGKGSGERWKDHLSDSSRNTNNPRKKAKINRIRQAGVEPIVSIWASDLFERAAYDLERELILRFGRAGFEDGGILTNLCVDANPPGFRNCADQETFRAKLSIATSGSKNPFFGKSHSDEVKHKISERHRGKTITEEHRAKISAALSGREVSEQTRERQSLAHKGRAKSLEHRAKIGDAHRGKIISDEQRAKISAATKGKPKSPETKERMRQAALLRAAKKKDKGDV